MSGGTTAARHQFEQRRTVSTIDTWIRTLAPDDRQRDPWAGGTATSPDNFTQGILDDRSQPIGVGGDLLGLGEPSRIEPDRRAQASEHALALA
jgi:hypothetical protein